MQAGSRDGCLATSLRCKGDRKSPYKTQDLGLTSYNRSCSGAIQQYALFITSHIAKLQRLMSRISQ
jgi:hypothetical protein